MDGMNPGLRTHKGASLRVAIPQGLPVKMWEVMRELLDVKSEDQARGEATSLLWKVCGEADRAWLTLMVQVNPFAEGLDSGRLRRFYAKFGFVEIQSEPCLMARSPQKPVIGAIQ